MIQRSGQLPHALGMEVLGLFKCPTTKAKSRFHAIPIKVSRTFFTELE